MTPSKILGIILLFSVGILVIFDVFTNKLKSPRLLLVLLFSVLTGAFLYYGQAEILFIFVIIPLTGLVYIWTEYLHKKLSGEEHSRFRTFTSRAGLSVFFMILSVALRYLLYPAMALFLNHLKAFVNVPNLMSVIITFFVVYALTIFFFGLLYATLHYYLNNAGFHSTQKLSLQDFFFFSAFNLATQGYKDMTPAHWLISLLSFAQIFIGIVLLGIYLAGAFTFIVTP